MNSIKIGSKYFVMRKIIVAVAVALIFSFVPNRAIAAADTSGIIHTTDGINDEWPAARFSANKETGIQYAVDNDAQNLYITMKIQDKPEQSKILQMGMRLFIDLKGKHKQNTGVEFPIHQEIRSDYDGLRVMHTVSPKIKLFGFTEAEPFEQSINTEGSVNLAFNWDDTETMTIEYLVPLSMFGQDILSLNNKLISIGWKINGVDMPVVSSSPKSTSLGGLPNNGVSKPGKPVNNATSAEMEKMMKEQDIWTKYTFNF